MPSFLRSFPQRFVASLGLVCGETILRRSNRFDLTRSNCLIPFVLSFLFLPLWSAQANAPVMLSRYTSGELGAHSSFATYLALDGSLLATYDKTGNGKVRVWNLATNGSLGLNRLINSPDTAHDTPTFGESIFLAGNRLGIGSGNTWKGNPHDGRFYIYDVTNGSKKTDFNPASHSAQYFGRESTFSTDVFCVSESGNSSWNTDAAYTFYHLNNFSPTRIHRYVHPGSYSYIGGMDSSGDVFVTTVEDPSDRHLFVWKVSRDGLNQPTGVSKFAEFTETGTNTVKGKIATNGQFIAVGISSSNVNGTNSGRVTLFEINANGSITKLHTLVPPDVAAGMKFGSSVKFVGNVLLVGSPYASTSSLGTGKVYAYLIADSNPPPAPVSFHPSTGQSGDTFGTFLAHSGNRLAVSAGQSVVFTYDVTNLAGWATPNQAPVFTTPFSVNAPENQTLALDANASDPDEDALVYSIAGGADQAKFDLNSSTGVLTFKIPPDFEVTGSVAGNNAYSVTIRVTDGTVAVTQALTINVTNLNEPPVFSNPTSVSVLENQTLALTVNASDPDGDSLTYSLAVGADQGAFVLNSFNSSTGLLTFKNAPDFEANASAAGNNSYSVTVQVTDGTSPVTQALTINVSDVYEPFVARQGTDRMGSAFVRSYLKLNEKLVLGFEVTGGQAEVLIKGLGPSYAGTGLPHAVSDPMVSLFDSGGQPILANDDWMSGPRAIHLTEASLTPASPKEAALLVTLSPGTYSVLCESNGAEEGMTGVEVREVGGSPGVGLNVLRANGSVSPQNPLVQGITVEGPNPRKLMIRAKGESSLGHQGVTSALKDPVLSASAYDPASGSYSLIAENGDWESGHRASEVAQTGFAPSTGSTDAVLLLDLVPGSYLFEANDQNGSGNGLVVTEVYDLGPGQSALDRPPVGIKLSVHEVPENAPLGTVVGVIGSTDPEGGSSPTHVLHDPQGTSDNGLFVLDADGSLRTARVFDYEKNATYRIAVRATDDANSFSDAVLEVRVTDLFRPIVETGLVESLTGVSATLKGEVVDDGGMGVTVRGIVFSVDPDPELGKSGVLDLPAGQGTGPFSAKATGLEPGRKYYFRAYAENVEGTGYGSDGEFVTLSDGPGWIDATPEEAKDWWTSPWLGSFFLSPNGWVRHAQLGWVFPVESPTAGLWLWKDGMGWLWTDKGVYPFLYGANGSGWHYFYGLHEGTTLFFDYQSKKWRTME